MISLNEPFPQSTTRQNRTGHKSKILRLQTSKFKVFDQKLYTEVMEETSNREYVIEPEHQGHAPFRRKELHSHRHKLASKSKSFILKIMDWTAKGGTCLSGC